MDPIEILGGLLGQKSGGGGMGGKILRDILGGALGAGPAQPESRPQPPSRPQPTSRLAPDRAPQSDDIESQARELEDLLSVATGRSQRRSPPPEAQRPSIQRPETQRPEIQRPETQRPETQRPETQRHSQFPPQRDPHFGQERSAPPGYEPPRSNPQWQESPQPDPDRQNEQALVLVRAMVNAAKCDGQISQTEQQQILERIGDTSPDTNQFLRDEFSKPLDVREFAWSVPLGMEQQVYTMSLIAIDFDSNREAGYLRELAHGLRLSPSICDQIHRRAGVPPLP